MVTSIEYFTGFSILFMFVVGLTMAIMAFRVWMKKREFKTILTAILFLALPFPWMTQMYIVVSTALDMTIVQDFSAYLSAWSIPVLVTSWVYLTLALTNKPVFRKIIRLR